MPAINDMAELPANAHPFRYDSTYGIYPGTIEAGAKKVIITAPATNEDVPLVLGDV